MARRGGAQSLENIQAARLWTPRARDSDVRLNVPPAGSAADSERNDRRPAEETFQLSEKMFIILAPGTDYMFLYVLWSQGCGPLIGNKGKS